MKVCWPQAEMFETINLRCCSAFILCVFCGRHTSYKWREGIRYYRRSQTHTQTVSRPGRSC